MDAGAVIHGRATNNADNFLRICFLRGASPLGGRRYELKSAKMMGAYLSEQENVGAIRTMILRDAAPHLLKGDAQAQDRDASKRLNAVILPELRQKYNDVIDIPDKASGNLDADRRALSRSCRELLKFGVLNLDSFGLQAGEIDVEAVDLKVLKIAQSAVNIVDEDSVNACGRSSRRSGLIEHQMLEQPTRLNTTRPRPDKFQTLSLSTAAIAELFINRRTDFNSIVRLDDFAPRLFQAVKEEFAQSYLDTPLMIKGGYNCNRIGKEDLANFFLHITFLAGNKQAGFFCSKVKSEVEHFRAGHRIEISRFQPAALVEEKYPESQTIFEWYKSPPKPKQELTAHEKTIVHWLMSRKKKWRELRLKLAMRKSDSALDKRQIQQELSGRFEKLERDARNKCTRVKRIEPSKPRMLQSMFEVCPSNGHLRLSDTSAALIRHIAAEGKIAVSVAPFVMALTQTALTRSAPSMQELISVPTLQRSFQRLGERDKLDIAEDFQKIKSLREESLIYLLTDNSHFARSERHAVESAYFDPSIMQPKLVFQTIAGGSDKTHEGDAGIDLDCLLNMGVTPHEDYGGFTGDNVSLGEGTAVSRLAQQLSDVATAELYSVRQPDDPHNHALNCSSLTEGAFGGESSAGQKSHTQLLHDNYYLGTLEHQTIAEAAENFMGGVKGPYSLVPNKPNSGRWLAVAQSAIQFRSLLPLKNPAGEPFVPNFYRQMSVKKYKASSQATF